MLGILGEFVSRETDAQTKNITRRLPREEEEFVSGCSHVIGDDELVLMSCILLPKVVDCQGHRVLVGVGQVLQWREAY